MELESADSSPTAVIADRVHRRDHSCYKGTDVAVSRYVEVWICSYPRAIRAISHSPYCRTMYQAMRATPSLPLPTNLLAKALIFDGLGSEPLV